MSKERARLRAKVILGHTENKLKVLLKKLDTYQCCDFRGIWSRGTY